MFNKIWPVSEEFKNKIIDIASKLQVQPDHLMAVIAFESGNTFKPDIKNKYGSGAIGLIQFMPFVAKSLGTTTEKLSKMTAVEQLDFVYKYLKPYSGRMKTLEDVYMSVLYPVAIGKGSDHVLFRKGTITYKQNAGLDINKNGFVTVYEAAEKVRQTLNKYKSII